MASVEDVCETSLVQTVRDSAVGYVRRCEDAPIGKLMRTVIVSINLVPLGCALGTFSNGWVRWDLVVSVQT